MYDIIGDIHGYAEPLKKLLEQLGYTLADGSWQHKDRKVIFVGDYIDRGPAIRETLRIVKGMTDTGNAIALMGNHEYNALAYDHVVDGRPLREHSTKNNHQHKATLEQFSNHREEWKMYLDWFYTLPLFFEDEGIRVIHACWDEDHIKWLKANCKSGSAGPQKSALNKHITMNSELLIAGHVKKSDAWKVIEETLKGKEFDIPKGFAWPDKDSQPRTENRIKWWIDPRANNYGKWLFDCPVPMQSLEIIGDSNPFVYPADDPLVLFGHYWLEDASPVIQERNIVCVDYSIAKKGSLVAYRWSGEQDANAKNFVRVRDNESPESILKNL